MKGWFRSGCAHPRAILDRNHAASEKRGLPWIDWEDVTPTPLAVVGGGESACEAVHWSGDIMAINGAADWLRTMGITPKYHVIADPRERVARFVASPSTDVRYLIASCCHPSVLDALDGQDVTLWLAMQGDEDDRPGGIPGGPSTLCRAPVIGAFLGYRDVHIFGGDSCYLGDTTHAYGDGPDDNRHFNVICDGCEYETSGDLIMQAEFMAELVPRIPFPVTFEGEHLMAAMIRTGGEWQFAAEAVPQIELEPFEVVE